MSMMSAVEIGRRRMMKSAAAVLGAAALGGRIGSTFGADADSQPAPADGGGKDRFSLGIFTSVYHKMPLEEAARRIREDGFSGVVLEFHFADVQFDPAKPDWAVAEQIMKTLRRHELRVMGLFGYYNVLDPNEERRAQGDARMLNLCKHWERFECPVISTVTGTFNAESPFREDPRNATEEGFVACREAFKRLCGEAEKSKAQIAIEPYWRNIVGSAERTERLFKEVDSPALKLTMDPCNYFENKDLDRMDVMLLELFRRVGGQTVLAHAKDVKRAENGPELPAPGLGEMNYPLYMKLLKSLGRPMNLVIEHLDLADVSRARDFVRGQVAQVMAG